MGFINLLHNGYRGKLGETVGQKWKNQLTLRTYQETNNSKSEAQLDQRSHYKDLISTASQMYLSSDNLILPPNSSMNKFNYLTSLIEKILQSQSLSPLNLKDGVYRRADILAPYLIRYEKKLYAYIYLPEGAPPVSMKDYPVSIIFNGGGPSSSPLKATNFFTGVIIPRKLKTGLVNFPTPRGFLAETAIDDTLRTSYVFSVGRKQQGKTEWSLIQVQQTGGNFSEDTTDPL